MCLFACVSFALACRAQLWGRLAEYVVDAVEVCYSRIVQFALLVAFPYPSVGNAAICVLISKCARPYSDLKRNQDNVHMHEVLLHLPSRMCGHTQKLHVLKQCIPSLHCF